MADKPVQPSVQISRSSEFKDIYSNFVRLGVSGADLSIIFGKLVENEVGMQMVEDQAVVRMSPHQFKTFLSQANKTLEAWETTFGAVTESMKSPSQSVITDGVRKLKDALDRAQA
jgi:hypothetical protein